MAKVSVDQNENAKCGQLEDKDISCWNSPDGQRLAIIKHRDRMLWLFDLFHMSKKKYSIAFNWLPTYMRSSFLFRALHWFHEDKALAVIWCRMSCGVECYFALMDINHNRSRCVLRDFRSLTDEAVVRNCVDCQLFPLLNGVGIVFTRASGNPTILHMFSNSPDGEPKWKEKTLLPGNFRSMGVIDGFIYGFLFVGDFEIDPSKLVKVCLETKEQTTLDVETPVETMAKWKGYSWVWIGRKLVTNLPVKLLAQNNSPKQLFIFDVDSLRWSQLEWEFKDQIHKLVYDGDNTLIVVTRRSGESDLTHTFYRFAINRPDTLANSCWMAIRNHAKNSPGFDRHVLTLLPKNSPFHYALGTRPPVKRRASTRLQSLASKKKARD